MTMRVGTIGRSTWKSLKLDFGVLIASIEKHSKRVDREAQVEHMSETSHFKDGTEATSYLHSLCELRLIGDQNKPRRIRRPIRCVEVSGFRSLRTRPRLMPFCSRDQVVLCTGCYEQ